jgi:Ni,Fe-hydrogenase maturation factor
MKILVFGNPLLKEDNLPLKLMPDLKKIFPKINFIEFDPTEELEKQGKDLIILDTIQGIKKITLIDSIEQISKTKLYSMHDFDLGYNLKILKKLKLINSVKIIGIPIKISKEKALEKIVILLNSFFKN